MFRGLFVSVLLSGTTLLYGSDKQFATRVEIQNHLFSAARERGLPGLQTQELGLKKKSPALAAMFSLLLPGLGEHYAEGWTGTGKFFTGLEGLLWLGYAGVDIYGNSLKDDVRSFAASHAGINAAGKDDDFFVDIGNFINVQEFNDQRLRDREPERLYNANAGFGWQWDSDANRALYKDRRISSEEVLNNRKFIVSAIIINHIASAINAARLAISYNKNSEQGAGGLQFETDVLGGIENPHGVVLTIRKNF